VHGREDAICDDIHRVLGQQLSMVEHPVEVVEIIMEHYKVEGTLKVKSRHDSQKSSEGMSYLLRIN